MGKIRVISLDFDGCVFNNNYGAALAEGTTDTLTEQLQKANPALFLHLRKQSADFASTIFMVGSNRQSYQSDDENRQKNIKNQKGINTQITFASCFPALIAIQEEYQKQNPLEVSRVDKFLMADVYSDLEDGKNFKRAHNHVMGTKTYDDHAHWIFDASKLTLLYAQMHRLAAQAVNDQVQYDFYDDRDDILAGLQLVFETYPELVPANVTLKLYKYAGNDLLETFTQSGVGPIDYYYRENVKELAACCLKGWRNLDINYFIPDSDSHEIHYLFDLKGTLDEGIDLKAFLDQRLSPAGYVLTQSDCAKSSLLALQELKEKSWLENSGENGTDTRNFDMDYTRQRIYFNGSNTLSVDKVLTIFFADYPELQTHFINVYSQVLMQALPDILNSITINKKYLLSDSDDNSIVNFKIVNGELFATVKQDQIILRKPFVDDEALHFPGSVKLVYKLIAEGFALQTLTASNSILKDMIMGEEISFEDEKIQKMAAMEEEIFAKLSDPNLNTETRDFFAVAAKLLKTIAVEPHKTTSLAIFAKAVVTEAMILKANIAAEKDLPWVTDLLIQQTRLLQAPGDFEVMSSYQEAAERVYQKPWSKRLGGAALITVGILVIAAAVTVSVLTFGFAAIAIAFGASLFGVGMVLGVTGIAGGAVLAHHARKATTKIADIEGVTKIVALASKPDQLKEKLFDKSRVRKYVESHPEILISLLKNLVNPYDLMELICKKRTVADKLAGKPNYLNLLLANAPLFKELVDTLKIRHDLESLTALQQISRLEDLFFESTDEKLSFHEYVATAAEAVQQQTLLQEVDVVEMPAHMDMDLIEPSIVDSGSVVIVGPQLSKSVDDAVSQVSEQTQSTNTQSSQNSNESEAQLHRSNSYRFFAQNVGTPAEDTDVEEDRRDSLSGSRSSLDITK